MIDRTTYDTLSVAEVAYTGRTGDYWGIYYTQVQDGREVSPITRLYRCDDVNETVSSPFLEGGYVFWSDTKGGKRAEIAFRQIPAPGTSTPVEQLSQSPWVRSITPQVSSWHCGSMAEPMWTVVYNETDDKDRECGLIRKGDGWLIPRSYQHNAIHTGNKGIHHGVVHVIGYRIISLDDYHGFVGLAPVSLHIIEGNPHQGRIHYVSVVVDVLQITLQARGTSVYSIGKSTEDCSSCYYHCF